MVDTIFWEMRAQERKPLSLAGGGKQEIFDMLYVTSWMTHRMQDFIAIGYYYFDFLLFYLL